MNRIEKRFAELSSKKEGALIAYVMGGDPSPRLTPDVVRWLVEGGADIVEVGIPFSDPIADGPSIQAAGVRALRAGATPASVLESVRAVRRDSDVPLAAMTYYNIIYSRGVPDFLDAAAAAGLDGLIVPDLPVEEASQLAEAARGRGMDLVQLAAPTTSDARFRAIVDCSAGFLYLVSLMGVTGARGGLGEGALELVARARRHTGGRLPLAVGFGISKPEHVRAVTGAGADGVVVGSAIVDVIAGSLDDRPAMARGVSSLVSSLKAETGPYRR